MTDMYEVPGDRLRELTDTINEQRARAEAAETERDTAYDAVRALESDHANAAAERDALRSRLTSTEAARDSYHRDLAAIRDIIRHGATATAGLPGTFTEPWTEPPTTAGQAYRDGYRTGHQHGRTRGHLDTATEPPQAAPAPVARLRELTDTINEQRARAEAAEYDLDQARAALDDIRRNLAEIANTRLDLPTTTILDTLRTRLRDAHNNHIATLVRLGYIVAIATGRPDDLTHARTIAERFAADPLQTAPEQPKGAPAPVARAARVAAVGGLSGASATAGTGETVSGREIGSQRADRPRLSFLVEEVERWRQVLGLAERPGDDALAEQLRAWSEAHQQLQTERHRLRHDLKLAQGEADLQGKAKAAAREERDRAVQTLQDAEARIRTITGERDGLRRHLRTVEAEREAARNERDEARAAARTCAAIARRRGDILNHYHRIVTVARRWQAAVRADSVTVLADLEDLARAVDAARDVEASASPATTDADVIALTQAGANTRRGLAGMLCELVDAWRPVVEAARRWRAHARDFLPTPDTYEAGRAVTAIRDLADAVAALDAGDQPAAGEPCDQCDECETTGYNCPAHRNTPGQTGTTLDTPEA